MEISRLIESLGGPAAYPFAVAAVEVRQTHISVVFLAGPFAFKLKKPVDFAFLDFTTLERRRHFCDDFGCLQSLRLAGRPAYGGGACRGVSRGRRGGRRRLGRRDLGRRGRRLRHGGRAAGGEHAERRGGSKEC